MTGAKAVPTLMILSSKLKNAACRPLSDGQQFQSIVGGLMYLTHTRPDIAFSVHRVAQYMHNPCEEHWIAIKRILRYLAETTHYFIVFHANSSTNDIVAFADADWATNPDDRRSISGQYVFLGENLVSWSLKKQKTVAHSAKYRSIADTVAEVVWIQSLLRDWVKNNEKFLLYGVITLVQW
ncbi:secreted RxLR effector protein 161-like [Hibiscus syriacus]|uniref:secreted RxLR effector protein 161-like n=1 Tax=Hibiscus syriacus TaxID=106335 RepID=UPI001920C773|nr:secreted RxLR effector protein 161-like [Hibiscus syriacus]